ncbi:DUF6289 family protein [Lysobacter silvisoli]|uniref:DUF6289 family protein n=1 Tax=Lysobacter silvisoli TaxID=2293254 RepID=UPI0011C02969|nr:DUF6289 family protein [Lysobacter silvisoli]
MQRNASVLKNASIAAALLGLLLAGAAVAGRAGEAYSVIYFDDAGNEVGGATANCGGQYVSWGERTDNYVRRTWICD